MMCYPVMIPTLCRYEHFRRCVESLSRNTHADKTELVIGLDYPPSDKYRDGYQKIKDYIPTISGFRKVTVFVRNSNFGAVNNWTELQNYAFEHYDAVIGSEDDNEFSPCFLDYMNKMLNFYKEDSSVSSVSGYLPLSFESKIRNCQVIFTPEVNGWGIGLWKNKELDDNCNYDIVNKTIKSYVLSYKSLLTFPASFKLALSMKMNDCIWGDVIRTQCNIFNKRYQVRPNISLCRNWGHDGTGVHCVIDHLFKKQQISEETIYDFEGQDVVCNSFIKKFYRSYLLPRSIIGKIKFLPSTILMYFKARKLIV